MISLSLIFKMRSTFLPNLILRVVALLIVLFLKHQEHEHHGKVPPVCPFCIPVPIGFPFPGILHFYQGPM
jgi:hypothetical protein